MTASFLNVREIEITPDHKRWRRYLAETMEGGRDIEVRPDRRRPQRNGVHIEEQPARLSRDTALGLQWTVEPKMGLDGVHPIQIAGLFGVLEPGRQALDIRRLDRLRRAAYGGGCRSAASSATRPPWEHPTRIAGAPFPTASITSSKSATAEKSSFFRAGLAKAPPIIRDRLVACADCIELRAPHPAVADRGVQKDNRVAVADDFRSQPGLAGRDLMI